MLTMSHRVDGCEDLFYDSPTSDMLAMVRDTIYSPPSSSGMGSAGSGHNLNGTQGGSSGGSNQNSCWDENHIYEDVRLHTPPKIAPMSGVLGKGKVVIRPIAFKPVIPRHQQNQAVRTPSHVSSSQSSDLEHIRNLFTLYNGSQTSVDNDNRSVTYSLNGDNYKRGLETPVSYASSVNIGGRGALHLEDFTQTPSPSDSGVAELEAMLREKDSEINYLRETMEHNEQVIFKVYEEKEHGWQREIKKLRAQYESQLKAAHQKVLMQTYQLQQEKRKLKHERDELKREKEIIDQQSDSLKTELEVVRAQLEETEWAMCQKTGEIALLKSQLKESHVDNSARASELLSLKAQLRQSKLEMEKKELESNGLKERIANLQYESRLDKSFSSSMGDDDGKNVTLVEKMKEEIKGLRNALCDCKMEVKTQRELFEDERMQWLEEKEKVIHYQKQLQLNYLQIYRRNHSLESEVEHLTFELEGRDEKFIPTSESQC